MNWGWWNSPVGHQSLHCYLSNRFSMVIWASLCIYKFRFSSPFLPMCPPPIKTIPQRIINMGWGDMCWCWKSGKMSAHLWELQNPWRQSRVEGRDWKNIHPKWRNNLPMNWNRDSQSPVSWANILTPSPAPGQNTTTKRIRGAFWSMKWLSHLEDGKGQQTLGRVACLSLKILLEMKNMIIKV